MATSMDFPNPKKKKYSDNLEPTIIVDPQMYIAVPGPQGERGSIGPKGDTGDAGIQGLKGDKGDSGKDGKAGRNGVDGKNILSPSEQNIGWACYDNLSQRSVRLGGTKGDDGWVVLSVDSQGPNTNELFLPKESVGLWNPELQKINFRTLNIGSIVTIRYNLILTTFNNNTEVWFRTFIDGTDQYPTNYVGNLKYQFDYDISMEHTLFVENKKIQSNGGIPQIRTDNDASAFIKSMHISVS